MILTSLLLTTSIALAPVPVPQSDSANEQSPVPILEPVEGSGADLVERSLATLSALRDSRQSMEAQLQRLRDSFDPNLDGEDRLQQLAELRRVQSEIDKLKLDFESIATGIDIGAFDMRNENEFNLMDELEGLLKPILSELRDATQAPREMERLRAAMDYATEHETLATNAIEHLNHLIDVAQIDGEKAEVTLALTESRDAWLGRRKELINRRTVAQFQLEQREARKRSFLDSAQTVLGDFFRTRGLNLLLAALAFFTILLGSRSAYRVARRLVSKGGGSERKFYARLVDVLYYGFSGLAALGGAMLVLYSAGDWAVLGVSILLLLGIGWASKTAFPIFFEQIKLLLNLGTVRDGERVTVNGLPWRVARLSLNTQFVNQELAGGRLRIPLRDLTALRSRPSAKGERWFPTCKNDWILLDGTQLARVEFQSPEMVRLVLKGGSKLEFQTTAFLAREFEVLSSGFRIQQRFGIDYEYQSICTDVVPEKMKAQVTEGLRQRFDPKHLRSLKVEFLEAGASSLDYAILADFKADAASQYMEINRALQALLVEVCNREGWSIPFTQLTLHTVSPEQ